MEVRGVVVKGNVIDEETRCTHYHSELDRIAIKFYCCQTYFPCYQCHAESGCKQLAVWPESEFEQKAILCGACGEEMTINTYLQGAYECSTCKAKFNPNCSLHRHLYFE